MPIPNPLVTFTAGDPLAAADLNANFANIDYLDAKINAEIQIPAGSIIPRASQGAVPSEYVTTTYAHNFAVLDYIDGSVTYADFSLVLPSDYDGGSLTYRVLWTANSTSTNSVVWVLRGTTIADDESLDAAFGTAISVIDANKSSAYDMNITAESSALTLGGTPAAGKMAFFSIHRDPTNGSDTLAATARLISVVLTYTRA